MALAKDYLHTVLVFLLAACGATAESGVSSGTGRALLQTSAAAGNSTIPAIFAFGDSTTDTGENKFLNVTTVGADLPPYGMTYFRRPTGRYSDGRLVIDFLAAAFGLPYFLPPYLQPGASFAYGVNFASAGSGALNATSNYGQIALEQQTQQFLALRNSPSVQAAKNISNPAIFSEALYFISTGGNDLLAKELYAFRNVADIKREDYIASIVASVQAAMTTLYTAGARKFLLSNVPPMGCLPTSKALNTITGGGCIDSFNEFALQYNQAVNNMSSTLRVQLANVTIVEADVYTYLSDVLANPRAYGFTEAEAGCCGGGPYNGIIECATNVLAIGNATIPKSIQSVTNLKFSVCDNPATHVFWDQIHGTEHLYQQVATVILTNTSYVRPVSLSAAFGVASFLVVNAPPGAPAAAPIAMSPNLPVVLPSSVAGGQVAAAPGVPVNGAFAPVAPANNGSRSGVAGRVLALLCMCLLTALL